MSEKILFRKKELVTLQQMLDSSEAEFLALYGRRRIGKTYLIRHFFKEKSVTYFEVTGSKKSPMKEQIKHFTQEIARVFYHNAPLLPAVNWDGTFEMLKQAMDRQPSESKLVLFFDEFPWMASQNSRLLETLEYYWNRHFSEDSRIKLIICGSSASWIIKKIIQNKAGLHNRLTHKIRLKPFSLKETKLFLESRGLFLDNLSVLNLYMMIGGIPYYLKKVNKGDSVAQTIEQLAFQEDSFLLQEFDNLFAALFGEQTEYANILRIIAQYRYGIGKKFLLKQLDRSQSGGQGIKKLIELEEVGFIQSFKPHFHKRQGIYYRLIDEYLLFYFYWIEPIRSTLQANAFEPGNWLANQNSPQWYSWRGYAFESVCYKHLPIIRKTLKLPSNAVANTWRYVPQKNTKEEGAQIDLLFDRSDDAITCCEIKYSNQPYVVDKICADNLVRRARVLKTQGRTQKQIFWTLITVMGIAETSYSKKIIDHVVTLQNLLEESDD